MTHRSGRFHRCTLLRPRVTLPGRPARYRCAAGSTPDGLCTAGWTRSWSRCPASTRPRSGAGSWPGRPRTDTVPRPHPTPGRSARPSARPGAGRISTAPRARPPGRAPAGHGAPTRRAPCSGAAPRPRAGTRTAACRPGSGPAPGSGRPSRCGPGCWSWRSPAWMTGRARSWSSRRARTGSRPGLRSRASTAECRSARTAGPSPRTAAAERPLALPDHDRVPALAGVGELGDQGGGSRTPRPRHCPALPHIEELIHDHPVTPHQRLGLLTLPGPRRHRVLPVLSRDPPGEHVPQPPWHRPSGRQAADTTHSQTLRPFHQPATWLPLLRPSHSLLARNNVFLSQDRRIHAACPGISRNKKTSGGN